MQALRQLREMLARKTRKDCTVNRDSAETQLVEASLPAASANTKDMCVCGGGGGGGWGVGW